MKIKNKILSTILSAGIVSSGFAGVLSLPSKNFDSYGASSDFVSVGESSVLGISSNEKYQVEGFELIRVFEKDGVNFAHFRHEKTGAQVIVCLASKSIDDIDMFFRAP